jgi:hypothetical protein
MSKNDADEAVSVVSLTKSKTCYSEEQVISMLEFLTDNIFVSFGWILFQQVVGIPMGYINRRNTANLELMIDETSSIYLYVKLKALAS